MEFIKFSVIFPVIFLSAAVVFASGGESSGGGEGAAEGAKPEKSKAAIDATEWYRKTQKLTLYETQVKDRTKELNDLIEKKNSGQMSVKDEKGNSADILDMIVDSHKQLVDAHKNYESERKEIKYRYPGEGDMVERRYMPLRPPTLEQVEKELGMAGELTALKNKVAQKYAPFIKTRPVEQPKRQDGPQSTIQESHEEPTKKKLKLEK